MDEVSGTRSACPIPVILAGDAEGHVGKVADVWLDGREGRPQRRTRMVMLRPSSAALAVASLLVLAPVAPTPARAESRSDAAPDRAEILMGRGDGIAASSILEAALPTADAPRRKGILEQLRRAYELAIRQSESDGQRRQAEAYRENLQILNRTPASGTSPTPTDPPAPLAPVADPMADEPAPILPEPADVPIPSIPTEPAPVATPAPAPALEVGKAPRLVGPISVVEPAAPSAEAPKAPAEPEAASGPSLAAADAAFRARNYPEAGPLYDALNRAGQLPESRRDHWAYCLCVGVVGRINARPKSADAWTAIHAEIRRIRQLSPKNWYGEYLRSLAAERSTGTGRAGSDPVVIRGSAPDEPARPKPAPRPSTPAASPAPRPTSTPTPTPTAESLSDRWQVLTTPNFRILHTDAELAGHVAKAAEVARDEQTRRWTGQAARAPWSPRCDIYLFPTAALFGRMTGQPEDSPGFSTMGLNSGRIVTRRVNLRADHPNLLAAVLPHEVTHVVLADLFPTHQIPRWADEGMAVLSEPAGEQDLRAGDLAQPLASGRLFKVEDLLTMDYPDDQYWGLYYAQSVSLTRFLVEQGSPAQFITFLQAAQRDGAEAQLRKIYEIDGYADLQRRWSDHARSTPAIASAPADVPTVRR